MMDRRTFLRRAGQAALALPLLQAPGRARAATVFPKRFIVFFQPNGTKKELWSPGPESGETGWTMMPLLAPLAAFQDKVVLFDGVDNKAAQEGPGGPHQRGMASLLTGQVITEGDFVGGDGRRAGWGGGLSVDQHIAQRLNAGTALTSLELGVRVQESVPRARLIYAGREQPVPPENDPVAVYQRVFGGMDPDADPEAVRRRLRRRESVLDSVFEDFADLERRVAAADREKLQRHASALRDLERRLGTLAEQGGTCAGGVAPEWRDPLAEAEFGAIMKAQIDLLVQAMACDLTRVGSIQASTAVNALRFTFDGLRDYQGHALSHAGDSNALLQGQWEQMLTWYSGQVAYLMQQLAAVPEGDGTMLDNTLILWSSELSRGNSHDLNDLPFVLAGGAGGALRGGRHLRYDGASHNELLLAALHLMGIEDPSFGDARFCSGPLAGVV